MTDEPVRDTQSLVLEYLLKKLWELPDSKTERRFYLGLLRACALQKAEWFGDEQHYPLVAFEDWQQDGLRLNPLLAVWNAGCRRIEKYFPEGELKQQLQTHLHELGQRSGTFSRNDYDANLVGGLSEVWASRQGLPIRLRILTRHLITWVDACPERHSDQEPASIRDLRPLLVELTGWTTFGVYLDSRSQQRYQVLARGSDVPGLMSAVCAESLLPDTDPTPTPPHEDRITQQDLGRLLRSVDQHTRRMVQLLERFVKSTPTPLDD